MAQETALTVTFNLNYDVRIIKIGEEFWFVAVDVAKVLGIEKIRNTLAHFPEDESGAHSMGVRSKNGVFQNRKLLCVNEAGLYRLIFISRKPEAENFKRWVFHDVLPQIRKTGSYSVDDSEGEEKPTPEYIPFEEGLPLLRQITADHPEWSWDLKDTKVQIDENGMIHHVLCFNMKIDD